MRTLELRYGVQPLGCPRVSNPFPCRSSRAMARTGLRMMPTSPSPPLKFRTAGFPQYGFKVSMSDRAFLENSMVKPAPGLPIQLPSLPPSFARLPLKGRPGSASRSGQGSSCRCSGDMTPIPRGPWLRFELYCLDPSRLTTTPSASPAGTLRFRFYTYTQRLRCAGAPRRPAGPSLLSLLTLSKRAIDPTPGGPLLLLSRFLSQRFQASSI